MQGVWAKEILRAALKTINKICPTHIICESCPFFIGGDCWYNSRLDDEEREILSEQIVDKMEELNA